MFSFLKKRLKRESWHPSIEELLLSMDGEIRAAADPKVEAHLRMCWSCRARQERIDQAISDFVKHRWLLRTARPGPSSRFVERFEARLDMLEQEKGRPSLPARLMASLRQQLPLWRLSWKYGGFLLACSLVAVVAVVVLQLSVAPPVSARVLLERVERAEAARIRNVARPVIYQKLRVRRQTARQSQDAIAHWEIWNDVHGRRSSARVEGGRVLPRLGDRLSTSEQNGSQEALPAVLAELEQVTRSNHMQQFNPLTVTSYLSWRDSIRPKTETVTEGSLDDDTKTLILTTTAEGPFAPNAVIRASLLVRAEDWHPIEQKLEVQRENETKEFTITETALQVVALSELPASIFPDLSPPLSSPPSLPVIAIPPVSIATPVATPVVSPTAAELMATEIDALYALHHMRACLRETIEVESVPEKWIEVRGLAETAERLEELRQVLRDLKFIKVNIQHTDHQVRRASAQPKGTISPDRKEQVLPVKESQAREVPTHHLLQRYFADSREPAQSDVKIVEFSTRAVSLSQAALAEAKALRRLVEWHGSGKTKELQSESAWRLEVMVREHLAGLKTATTGCRILLEPVLTSLISPSAMPTPETGERSSDQADLNTLSWTAKSLSLIALVEKIDYLVHYLFAFKDTKLSPERTREAGQELASALSRLEGGFVKVHAELASEFSGHRQE